ncbi:unnamed protein product [Auanema sp. JU1783]|nr:unnamed protein product [Auanema sp. JU1783]
MFNQIILILATCVTVSVTLTCYDCYNTGPDHKDCTKERFCKGVACMIFEDGDNKTSTAFCLLAIKETDSKHKEGCWLEPDGKSKHCMCQTDFCNKLTDRRGAIEDPLAPLLPDAQFLKQNPLVDYENPKLDGDDDEDDEHNGAAPPPDNLLFPGADKIDSFTSGKDGEDEDDLVSIDFEEYDRKDDSDKSNKVIPEMVNASPHPPSTVLMFLTMATSWARLLVNL